MLDVQDLKLSANFQEERFNGKIKNCQDQLSSVRQEMQDLEKKFTDQRIDIPNSTLISDIKAKLNDLENKSRRNNLRFDGLKDSPDETWEESERKLAGVLNQLDLDPNEIEFERAHRVGKFDKNKKRTIIVKMLRYKDREDVLKAARKKKLANIYVNEDYCEETIKRRKELIPVMKEKRAEGKFCYINVDKLVVRDRRD